MNDDGVGFDLETRLHASHGFAGMRHRVEALNGTLQVSSNVGRGTRIHVLLPKTAPARVESRALEVASLS